MSALILDELTLSEQVAVATAWATSLARRTSGLLNTLEPLVNTPLPPLAALADCCHPLSVIGSASGSNSSPAAEETAMVEKMVSDHPPLLVCYPGHRAHMWEATGNREVVYYVECSLCGVRTARYQTADTAAHAWGQRQVSPIIATVAA